MSVNETTQFLGKQFDNIYFLTSTISLSLLKSNLSLPSEIKFRFHAEFLFRFVHHCSLLLKVSWFLLSWHVTAFELHKKNLYGVAGKKYSFYDGLVSMYRLSQSVGLLTWKWISACLQQNLLANCQMRLACLHQMCQKKLRSLCLAITYSMCNRCMWRYSIDVYPCLYRTANGLGIIVIFVYTLVC